MSDELNNNKDDWKNKIQGLLNTCQTELKKTTKIGVKMFHASKSNVNLHEKYEELGLFVFHAFQNNELELKDMKALKLIDEIKELESKLEKFEEDVKSLKEE